MMKKVLLVCLCFALMGTSLGFAGNAIGQVVFFSGDVTITRNGVILSSKQFTFGSALEDFDMIRTGANGKMDLTIKTMKNQQIQLSVKSNTAFYIEQSKLANGNDRTSFEMMTGTIACKVDKLSGSDVQVRTKSAAMGVRGTNFEVTTAPTDDILVTCDEGRVSCINDDGKEFFAEPGSVVEELSGEKEFRRLSVKKEDIEKYRDNWFIGRLGVFKSNASRVIKTYVGLFEQSYDKLVSIYAELAKKKAVFDKWIAEDKQGKTGSRVDMMREKSQVVGLLLRAKGNLFIFDRVYYRILELEYYFEQGYGSGDIRPGYSIKKFFDELRSKKQQIDTMVARVRYFFKLFAVRNDGHFPVDTEGSDESFFDDGGLDDDFDF